MQSLLRNQLTTLRNLEARGESKAMHVKVTYCDRYLIIVIVADLAGCEGNEVCADLVLDAMYDALHRALEEVTRDMGTLQCVS